MKLSYTIILVNPTLYSNNSKLLNMNLNNFLILLSLLLSIHFSCVPQKKRIIGMEICLTQKLLDSLHNIDYHGNAHKRNTSNNLFLIHKFNSIKRMIGQRDTIKIYKVNPGYSASYRNKVISLTNETINEENLITIWGSAPKTIKFFYSESFDKVGKNQRIIISNNSTIEISNYTNEVISGSYKKLKYTGEPLVIGNYSLKDSTYQDTTILYDPDTYDETIKIVTRKHVGVQCGEWRYYDIDGKLEVVKYNLNCK